MFIYQYFNIVTKLKTSTTLMVSILYLPTERRRKEGNVLFNDTLNIFLFYGYMASDIW